MKRSVSLCRFWSSQLFGAMPQSSRGAARGRRSGRSYRLTLEALEERTTPAAVPFFTPPPISTAADDAASVAVADLDGDGDLDVLSASGNDDKIAWYENDGATSPSFTEHVISLTANAAVSVSAADVDGDGDTDVLSASSFDDKIAWYENTAGDGSAFTLHTISTTAELANSVAAADLDGDGDTDVLSASPLDSKIAWYENTVGDGSTFTLHTLTTSATGATSVVSADLDGDRDLDVLFTASPAGTIGWLKNDGAADPTFALFTISTTTPFAQSAAAADVDGDGDLDVLSASSGDDKIAWFENNGAATSFTPHTISTSADGASSVSAADLDGDGDTDVLSASQNDDKVAWYENDGAALPAFAEHVISTTADNARSVAVADLDGDGDLDVLSASINDDKIAWFRNDRSHRSAAFPQQVNISTNADLARSVAVADLDGDGDLDVLSASINDDKIAWYENNGAALPAFTKRTITTTANGASSVAVADLDGDGDLDVLSASGNDNTIAWYENDGAADPTFTKLIISAAATGAVSVAAADLDGDGDIDVLSASFFDDTIAWYENDGAADPTFTTRNISLDALGARSVAAADLDGDGDLDVLSASEGDDSITWYENNGAADPGFTRRGITANAEDAQSVAAADLDGDGDLDVLSASESDDTIAWYENNGAVNPTFTPRTISIAADGATSVVAADVDGDGDLDVLSASQNDSKVAWYENDGAALPSFTPHTVSTAAINPRSVAAADLDGDGDTDVLSASSFDDRIAWYPNQPPVLAAAGSDTGPGDVRVLDGVTGEELIRFTAYNTAGYVGGARVALADVTGDGVPDLIVAPGSGLTGGALVKVFDGADLLNGKVTLQFNFHPYGLYTGEVFVAAGRFNGDNRADIVTSNVAAGPTVKVFDAGGLANGDPVTELGSFQPFGPSYKGGVRVAGGDVNGNGTLDVIAGQSKNGSKVRAISGVDFTTVLAKTTVSPATVIKGGVFVAAGNSDGDNRVDIIVGLGAGAKPKVFVYEDSNNADTKARLLKKSAPVYGPAFKGGVRVAAADLDGDGRAEVLAAAGPGLSPYRLRVLDGLSLTFLDAFFSQAPDFNDARSVAAARFA